MIPHIIIQTEHASQFMEYAHYSPKDCDAIEDTLLALKENGLPHDGLMQWDYGGIHTMHLEPLLFLAAITATIQECDVPIDVALEWECICDTLFLFDNANVPARVICWFE